MPDDLRQRVEEADETYFAGLRAMLGLDQVVAINVGAAPTPVEVLEFFHAIGLPLVGAVGDERDLRRRHRQPARQDQDRHGRPCRRRASRSSSTTDGEVLIRADVVMLGYRNLPDKTAETFTEDGWLRTGDIGELDDDGYLKIVDRKKEIIINAAGKNMSPANIEATLKTASPLIGQAAVIGDGRSYNTALIVLDADFAPAWAAKLPSIREDASLEALATDDACATRSPRASTQANAKLARVEQIKKFTIVEGDWLPGGDELTPTMKLKRKPIAEKYTSEIEAMYAS